MLKFIEKFMQEQREEFELGKKHLANMMGRDVESMDEREINVNILDLSL